MSRDFEKAFDKISHHFLFQIMEKLGFGKRITKFIKIMYKDISSKIEINGTLTGKIKFKRGIRQGCPLSMLLFILASDVLTRLIQKNKLIKGVQFQKEVFKISQFADDTIFAFQNENEINYINKELDTFGKISGLKINTSKTQIIITEPLLKCKIQNKYPNLTITDKLKILGITFYSEGKKA